MTKPTKQTHVKVTINGIDVANGLGPSTKTAALATVYVLAQELSRVTQERNRYADVQTEIARWVAYPRTPTSTLVGDVQALVEARTAYSELWISVAHLVRGDVHNHEATLKRLARICKPKPHMKAPRKPQPKPVLTITKGRLVSRRTRR